MVEPSGDEETTNVKGNSMPDDRQCNDICHISKGVEE
jgi:hypothetical protein